MTAVQNRGVYVVSCMLINAKSFNVFSSLNDPSSSLDKHPEKRMKACYEEFESVRLPQLKAENPNARLSQLKQMLRKEWMKSPDNPLNKKLAAMNSKS